ncbi:DUF2169 domain-containing protein [Pseudenhygromyxa sp. WMMC2535]|uniref:DUF2169 family type VI secretion system accessory protein n=1 Tax=Pseudenhygromyxa sp. WMMC2535 TaxID=2712867 RepID=UPI0015535ED8|nr:DUF2169 domain-containing protein [Pseudenhygromyxa sp. WMMC2535]NVB40826.1 DUF2169 domain-containing protein [Pseudenhygromyxa sp. WMMC2535]
MQITANTTGMIAGSTVAADADAVDHCLVVVKGTFSTSPEGALRLTREQRPLITCDEHYGDPASSAIRYESDFALFKPRVDVLVVGEAVAPGGLAQPRLRVGLELPGTTKTLEVVGERSWVRAAGALFPSNPVPFTRMPLRFDRAVGGPDERRNLVGVGYHPERPAAELEGLPVPNLERPGHPLCSPRSSDEPVGFGVVGRSWAQRLRYAGTYDQRWRDERAPYLPADFDPRYNQSAPEDQQLATLRGGEELRCIHMAAEPVVRYRVPELRVPVCFRFVDADTHREARLDTLILEPHLGQAQLLWRCAVPLRRRPSDLREILIGDQPPAGPMDRQGGKPRFRRLGDAVRALRERKRGASCS